MDDVPAPFSGIMPSDSESPFAEEPLDMDSTWARVRVGVRVRARSEATSGRVVRYIYYIA